MSEPADGASTRHTRLGAFVAYVMDHAGDGVSTAALEAFGTLRFGLRHETVRKMLEELRASGALRFDKDGWHSTQKAREFFK